MEPNPYILFYDLECNQFNGIPFMITYAIYDCMNNSYVDFDTSQKLYDNDIPVYYNDKIKCLYRDICRILIETKSQPSKIYMMAYNGNKFDHLYMLNGMKMNYFLKNGNNVISAQFEAFGIPYETRDLRDYITTGNLAGIGDQLGVPKLTTGFDDLNYAIRDTAIMCLAWRNIILKNYGAFLREMLPNIGQLVCYRSTAAISYEYVCRSMQVEMLMTCPNVNDYFKLSYYGAKCDYSKIGVTENVAMYDIRSMYPASMKEFMPHGDMYYTKREELIPLRMYIATVTLFKQPSEGINIDSTFGVVPTHHEGKTEYVAAGRITTVMTSVDVENACLDGWRVIAIKDCIQFSERKRLFNIYDKLYTIKQSHKKDSAAYWFSKIVMNSSIGKFASGGDYVPHYINYFCMAYSRRMLVSLKGMMRKVNIPYVIYGDTDSICLHQDDMDKLLIANPELISDNLASNVMTPTGEVECRNQDIIVLGKKLYYINESKYSAKGHNHKQITRELFMDVVNGKDKLTTRESPDKYIYYSEKDHTVNSGVYMFETRARAINATFNKLKKRVNNVFTGPFIINL